MQTQQLAGKLFRQHNVVSFVVNASIAAVYGLLLVGATPITSAMGVHGQLGSVCSSGDRTLTVAGGDTLGSIASHYGMSVGELVGYNHIVNSNFISANQTICVPGQGARGSANTFSVPITHTSGGGYRTAKVTAVGNGNTFPYGACTWWADQRYYQLHGVFVPWRINANAAQWPVRAQEFGWRVSSAPSVGDILALQGGVQGASWLGHVGVVERVLGNGHVIASSMSWGAQPGAVTWFQFTLGPGVTFIGR